MRWWKETSLNLASNASLRSPYAHFLITGHFCVLHGQLDKCAWPWYEFHFLCISFAEPVRVRGKYLNLFEHMAWVPVVWFFESSNIGKRTLISSNSCISRQFIKQFHDYEVGVVLTEDIILVWKDISVNLSTTLGQDPSILSINWEMTRLAVWHHNYWSHSLCLWSRVVVASISEKANYEGIYPKLQNKSWSSIWNIWKLLF